MPASRNNSRRGKFRVDWSNVATQTNVLMLSFSTELRGCLTASLLVLLEWNLIAEWSEGAASCSPYVLKNCFLA